MLECDNGLMWEFNFSFFIFFAAGIAADTPQRGTSEEYERKARCGLRGHCAPGPQPPQKIKSQTPRLQNFYLKTVLNIK